jgi:hypothetical protein
MDFNDTFASLKSRKFSLYHYKKQEEQQKSCHNLNLLLLIGASII